MPIWIALSFQDNASPSMEHILFFHDHAIIILTIVTVITLYLIISLIITKNFNKYITEGQEVETIWTLLPTLILIFIALPSLKTLYLIEDTKTPAITIKTTGHQWYWSYEYSSINSIETENFLTSSNTVRLLKTRDILYMPINTSVRILLTSADVIHSWALPSLGVKVDALPGRLNQLFLLSKRLGIYTGQCSEICGANHSFIPVIILVQNSNEFIKKIKTLE